MADYMLDLWHKKAFREAFLKEWERRYPRTYREGHRMFGGARKEMMNWLWKAYNDQYDYLYNHTMENWSK